jgi:hypothetical protein
MHNDDWAQEEWERRVQKMDAATLRRYLTDVVREELRATPEPAVIHGRWESPTLYDLKFLYDTGIEAP